jgi:excisionase family DNA binding protein
VARAGSRIKRVVAASGRKFASPATSDSSASDPVESKTASTISADAELTAAEVETNAVEQCLDIPSAASTREVISRKDGATRLPSALAPAVPNLPIRSATARGVAVHGAKVRQRVRQRPETRTQMLERLTNPTISLYEASVLLDVCSATVRRYTNSGVLPHVRTDGGQRRFRLHDVLVLMRDMEGAKKQ